jgi:hypothetical protein
MLTISVIEKERIIRVLWVDRRLLPARLPDELFQLLRPHLLHVNGLLSLLVDPVVGVQFFLQLDYGLVSLVQSAC